MNTLVRWVVALALAFAVLTAIGMSIHNLVHTEETVVVAGAPPTPSTMPGAAPSSVAATSTSTVRASSAAAPSTAAPALTLAELAKHSSASSCWLLISGKLYDVTDYLAGHPGGVDSILPWCGKESTEAFATEDGEGQHSRRAYNELTAYEIGPLGA